MAKPKREFEPSLSMTQEQGFWLGAITIWTAAMDHLLNELIAELQGIPVATARITLTRLFSYDTRLQIASELIENSSTLSKTVKESWTRDTGARSRLKKAFEQRNRAVHGVWRIDDHKGWRIVRYNSDRYNGIEEAMNVEELKKIHSFIYHGHAAVSGFLGSLEWNQSSPSTRP